MKLLEFYKFYVFIGAFLVFVCAGYLYSFRENKVFEKRFILNIGFSVLNSIIILAIMSKVLFLNTFNFFEVDYGILFRLHWHWTFEYALGLILLDLMIYWQHRLFHVIPLLWRFHRLHHSDNDFDSSTALRFHPFEAVVSLMHRLLLVYIFGISFFTLVIFEIVLNFAAMFNHSNFALPKDVENKVGAYIITPDLHRIHHSLDLKDSNKNFGFSVTFWDLIFKSYKKDSLLDLKSENLGVLGFQSRKKQSLWGLLSQPFV